MKRVCGFIVAAILSLSTAAAAQLSYKQIGSTATGSAGGAVSASLGAPTGGQTNYLEWLHVGCPPPAAVESGLVTVTGLAIGTIDVELVETVAAGADLWMTFPVPEAASASNTAIAVNVPAIASGSACTVSAGGRAY